MRLLLVQPPTYSKFIDNVFIFEPLALEYLGAGARLDGHEVRLVDARVEPDIDAAAREFRPEVVGITAFTSQVNIAKSLAARLRELCPEAFFVAGGHHATVAPRDFSGPEFDVVVVGEGVFALREIMAALQAGNSLREIRGLALPLPGGMEFTPPRAYTALDSLPFPDRSLTARYRKQYFSEWFKPLASIRTSIGCTARCTFCSLWSITGGKYLRRSPDAVVAELAAIEEPNVFFCDDESMCDAGRMAALAGKIRESGIRKRYFLYARADTIARHPELFAEWARIGLAQVFVGMEDYSDERLAAMRKGLSVDQQRKAVQILDRLGVAIYASFMVDPGYAHGDFQSLINYIRELKLRHATFTVMTPLPGTELRAANEDRLLSRRPELCDMLHSLLPTRLTAEEFYGQMARLWTEAVPFHRGLPLLLKFGLRGMFLRIRFFSEFLRQLRAFHLDY